MATPDRTHFVPRHRGPNIFPNTPLFSQLLRHARRGRLAIRDVNLDLERTYAQTLSDTLELRSALLHSLSDPVRQELDQEHEVFVGILAAGGYEYTVAMLAVLAAGAVPVPMTVALPLEEAKYFVQKSRQAAIITSKAAEKLAKSTAKIVGRERGVELPCLQVLSSLQGQYVDSNAMIISSDQQLDERAAGLVIFTSGTSGPPKGAVLRRGFMSEETRSIIDVYGITHQDTILHLLPVHHATGAMINFLPFLMAGSCIEFRSGNFDAAWTWERFRRGGVAFFSAVPTIYMRMMRHFQQVLSHLPDAELANYKQGAVNVRVFMCGTSALPRPVQDFWTDLRGRSISARYGSTEAGAVFFAAPDDKDVPDGSVGLPASGTDVLLSNGNDGEILLKAPYMFSKYLFDESATASAHDAKGYFKTGDIAHREKGYYFIDGRASQDILKSGGYKISALDVEREILSLPYVAEVMVVGVSDPEWGQRVGAVVSLRADQKQYTTQESKTLAIADVRSDLRERLAGYKMPTLLRVVEGDLPKTASGKVLKRTLGPQFFPVPGWQNDPEVQVWRKPKVPQQAKL